MTWTGFPSSRKVVTDEMQEQAARLWRDGLSSIPWYAERAKQDEERTGDPMHYWRTSWGSRIAILERLGKSSTADAQP